MFLELPPHAIWLALIVVGAHLVETVLGFGATIFALSVGGLFVPLETWMAVLVILGITQSIWLAANGRRHIDWRALGRIVPAAAVGLVAGIFFRDQLGGSGTQIAFGAFVAVFAVIELAMLRKTTASRALLGGGLPYLFAGGVVHGLFATGGPLIVYYAGRTISSRLVFRATLAVLWLGLNLVLAGQLGWNGQYSTSVIQLTALLLPAAFLGIAIGERLTVNDHLFRYAAFALLAVAGVMLAMKGMS